MKDNSNEQITIDGPAASGKSTLARCVALKVGAYCVNTGDMYRSLTWLSQKNRLDPVDDRAAIVRLLDQHDMQLKANPEDCSISVMLDGQPVRDAIRASDVTAGVSHIAVIPEVREWMVKKQQESKHLGLIVMEGRDIGTVVFPEAKYKFFVTASPRERALRRLRQDGETPDNANLESVTNDIIKRDKIDSERKAGPLKPAPDAYIMDTTSMTIDEAVNTLVSNYLEILSMDS